MAPHQRDRNYPEGRTKACTVQFSLVVLVGLLLGGQLLCSRLSEQNPPLSLPSGFLRDVRSKFLRLGEDIFHGDSIHNPFGFLRTESDKGGREYNENENWTPNVIFENYTMPISFRTQNNNVREIQRAFDVGLVECYGFAFFEARKTANNILQTLLDDSPLSRGKSYCPMCYWLLAMGHSPYINHPLIRDPSDFESASKAADLAYDQAHNQNSTTLHLSTKEIGLIDAMQLRFSPPSSFQNQTIGYKFYENALRDLYEQIMEETSDRGDADVMAFLVDSIMVTHADADGYNFYNKKTSEAFPEIEYAITLLKDCLDLSPNHPLCQHLYIHITEPSHKMVSLSGPVADNLLAKTTGTEAQHLQHMPSHSYLRIGRYHDAVNANVVAHASDQHYEDHGAVAYGVAHDLAVLIHAAGLSGEKSVALEYSNILRENYQDHPNRRDGPGTGVGWHLWRTIRLGFGDFAAILNDGDEIPRGNGIEKSEQNASWPYAVVLGNYAKGVAYLWEKDASVGNEDRLSEAKLHLKKIRETISSVDLPFQGMVSVADSSLDASIRFFQILKNTKIGETQHQPDDFKPVLELFRLASTKQDSWRYSEPPLWHTSLKLCEGTLLRIMGHYYESIQVFTNDLIDRPDNRYALYGLWKALKQKGVSEQKLRDAQDRFEESSSWADKDVKEKPPLVCPELGE